MSRAQEQHAELAKLENCLAILAGGARTKDVVGDRPAFWSNELVDTTHATKAGWEAKCTSLRMRLGLQ
jgi:hypothetical protein